MTFRVKLTPGAEHDLARLAQYLAESDPDAAIRAVEEITDAAFSLREFPERGLSRPDGLRQLVVRFGKGGYHLRYRVRGQDVLVTRIFHTLERR